MDAGPPSYSSQSQHNNSSHHNVYPPPPLPPSISRTNSTMYNPTPISFYNSDQHYRAPHQQTPQHLLPTSNGQDHLIPGGSAHSYDHPDGLAYGQQHQPNSRWPTGIYSDLHASSSHAQNGSHPAGLPMMAPHSQGPSPTYHQISPAAHQPVNSGLMYNDLMQMQQPQSGYLAPQQGPYIPRTTASWDLRVSATAGSHNLSPLTALDGQSSISTSPTSHTPLVGKISLSGSTVRLETNFSVSRPSRNEGNSAIRPWTRGPNR